MGIVARQGIINSIWQYIGIAVGYVNTVLLFPKILLAEQFGLTRVMWSAATLTSMFANVGMPGVLVKFFPKYTNTLQQRKTFLWFCLLATFLGLLISSLLLLISKNLVSSWFTDKSQLFPVYYYLLPLLLIYNVLYNFFDAYLKVQLKTSFSTFLRDVLLRIGWLALIVGYYYNLMGFDTFMFLYVNVFGVILLIQVSYTLIKYYADFSPTFRFSIIDKKTIRKFAVYAILGTSSGYIANYIDVLMVGGMINLKSAAIYSVAFYISSVISVPLKGINKITAPLIAQSWKDNDVKKINTIYYQSANSMLLVALWIFIGIWANIHNIFSILPQEYEQGKWVLLFIALAKVYDASCGLNGLIIQFSDKFRWMLYFNIIMAVVVFISNLLLIPEYGVNGAAAATFLSIIIINSARLIFLKKQYNLFPFSKNDFFILLIGSITLLLAYILPRFSLILDIIIRSAIVTVIYFSMNIIFKTSPEFNKFIKKHLKI